MSKLLGKCSPQDLQVSKLTTYFIINLVISIDSAKRLKSHVVNISLEASCMV